MPLVYNAQSQKMEYAFFPDRNPIFLHALAKYLEKETFQADDIIIAEGEHGFRMYLILCGKVEVSVGPKMKSVAFLHRGDHFGEMALFGNGKRAASVIACERTDCLVLKRRSMSAILQKFPEEKLHFARVAHQRRQELKRVDLESVEDSDDDSDEFDLPTVDVPPRDQLPLGTGSGRSFILVRGISFLGETSQRDSGIRPDSVPPIHLRKEDDISEQASKKAESIPSMQSSQKDDGILPMQTLKKDDAIASMQSFKKDDVKLSMRSSKKEHCAHDDRTDSEPSSPQSRPELETDRLFSRPAPRKLEPIGEKPEKLRLGRRLSIVRPKSASSRPAERPRRRSVTFEPEEANGFDLDKDTSFGRTVSEVVPVSSARLKEEDLDLEADTGFGKERNITA